MNNERVTFMEIILLSVTVVISTAVLFLPYLTARAAGQDAWISVLVAGAIGTIPAWCVGVVMARFPHMSVVEALPYLLGTVLGKLVGLAVLGALFFGGLMIVWQFEEFIVGTLMPETPAIAVRLLFVLAVAFTVFHGAVPLLRTNVYILPLGIIVIALVLGLPMARMNPRFLLPVMENGPWPVLDGAALLFAWLCQIPLVVMMFHRFVANKFLLATGRKNIIGIAIVTLALLAGSLGTIATFGPRQTASRYYPSFGVARIISVGAFLENMEVIFVGVWIAAMFVTGVYYVMSFSDGLSDFLGMKRNLWLYGIIYLALLIWPAVIEVNVDILVNILNSWFPWVMATIGGGLPIILFFRVLTLPARKPGEEEENNKKDDQADEPGI